MDIRFPGGMPFRAGREREEALSLIRRLVLSPGVAIDDRVPRVVTLVSLDGGRSAARVFKLTPSYGYRRLTPSAPVVVKIAPRLQGTGENANYERFVRRGLPPSCRPDLLAFGRTRAHAGLCYSFVGRSGGRKPDTLTDCLKRGDTTKIELVLRRLFDPLRETWYSPASCRRESDIARRYLERLFTGPRATAGNESALRACAARYFNASYFNASGKGGRYVIGGVSFPAPRATLFASCRQRPYASCILHGDLNSDNVLFADDPFGVTIVDFQKTGRGHVHQDLVFVEASVRINDTRDASFGGILEQERQIALGVRPLRGDAYSVSIRKIRDAARRYFGDLEAGDNYHFAVAATGLRLMQAVDLTHVARARITASTLWAAKVLAGEMQARSSREGTGAAGMA